MSTSMFASPRLVLNIPLGISPLTQGAPFYRGTWVPTLGCQTCNTIKSKTESDYKKYNSIKSTKNHIPHGYKVFLVNKIRKRFLYRIHGQGYRWSSLPPLALQTCSTLAHYKIKISQMDLLQRLFKNLNPQCWGTHF